MVQGCGVMYLAFLRWPFYLNNRGRYQIADQTCCFAALFF